MTTASPYVDLLKTIVLMTLLIPEDAFADLMSMNHFDTVMPILDPTGYRETRHQNAASNLVVQGLKRFQADLKQALEVAKEGQNAADGWAKERAGLEFLR